MHWLPLVAMVIASALPFPHNPASRIAAATAQPGFDDNHDQAEPVDYNSYGNASQTDYNMADTVSQRTHRQNLQDSEEYVKSSTDKQTSKVANQGTYQSNVNSGGDGLDGVLRVEDDALPKDYNADRSRQDFSSFTDSSSNPQDPTQELSPLATAGFRNSVSPAAALKAQSRPEPTESTIRTTAAGKGPTEGRPNLEAGLGLEGDEMFLDAHPRVLFSPSPSPPEHPPLLLMLESGMLEEDGGDGEEQEDIDAHIEGHGDRALDRTPSWADFSRVTPNVRAVKRDKRDKQSDLIDRRRGERSVCESESVWVTNKTTAIDYHGQNVTILQEIQTQTGPLKQYFYETRCRAAEQPSGGGRGRPTGTGVAGAGCLGVDKKQWVSECKAKQSFVRALTRDPNNRTGWRWIRIDSSCVCVLLSRTNQALAREVLMRRGRG